jgi:hypothetical protein
VESLAVSRGVRVSHQIHRVGETRRGRQDGRETPPDGIREPFDPKTGGPRRVGGDDAEATAIGHHHEPTALGQRLARESTRHVEELFYACHPHRARHPGGRGEGRVGAGQRARVRGDRPRAFGRAAGLEEDDRLDRGHGPERVHETLSVRDSFEVGGDDPRLRILGRRLQKVALVQVGLIPQTGKEGKAQAPLAGPVEDGNGERAGV